MAYFLFKSLKLKNSYLLSSKKELIVYKKKNYEFQMEF